MNTQNVKTAAHESSERYGKNSVVVDTQNIKAATPKYENNLSLVPLPPMRGLDVRLAWGKAKLMPDSDKARAVKHEVLYKAKTEGYHDYSSGFETPPLMYQDEQSLVNAWRKGWGFHHDSEVMACCDRCNDNSGDPCPYHD